MSDIEYDGELLHGAATQLSGKVGDIPTTSPLDMSGVTEGDVTAAANNFNMWVTYTGLVARAQLTSLGESVTEAALALDAAEAQLAEGAVAP